jgi:hypothetical protein
MIAKMKDRTTHLDTAINRSGRVFGANGVEQRNAGYRRVHQRFFRRWRFDKRH